MSGSQDGYASSREMHPTLVLLNPNDEVSLRVSMLKNRPSIVAGAGDSLVNLQLLIRTINSGP